MKKRWRFITISELVAALIVLAVVVAALISRLTIFSPGPLSAQTQSSLLTLALPQVKDSAVVAHDLGGVTNHAQLAGQCGACHAPPWSAETMAQRCLVCHTEVAAELQNPHDLHYVATASIDSLTCTNGCHTEHNGPAAPVTLVKPEHFTGTGLKFSLNGHKTNSNGQPFNCTDCHLNGLDSFNPNICVTCHVKIDSGFTQPHIQAFGQDCMKCHDGQDSYGKAFDHSQVDFKLLGAHASSTIACTDCHKNARTTEDLKSTPKDCLSCHQKDDKHNGALGNDCAQCHNELNWKQISYDHQQTAYPLTGKHVTTDCLSCHVDNVLKGIPQTCSSCHQKDDKHDGKLNNCADCHTTSDWKLVSFDHQQTTYPLTGKHVDTACTACHTDNLYKGTPSDCSSCHQKDDTHKGALGQDCVQCHTSSDWKKITFQHETTTYPLTGKHITADCTSCHLNGILKGTPSDCYTCHQKDDKHQGALGQNCVLCHTTSDWPEITFHHETTAYPLTGKHTTVDCTSCHSNGILKGTPSDCYSCHQKDDKHQGALGQSCVLCHATTDWKDLTFDHAKTSFPLTGNHASAACASCHSNGTFKGTPQNCSNCHQPPGSHFGAVCASCHNTVSWNQATMNHATSAFPLTGLHTSLACTACHVNGAYQGTPTDCYACHKSNDTHNGANGTNCASCHNTSGWTQVSVNHATTAFPLTGLHTSVACASCHVNGVYKGTPTDCYACHKSNDTHNGANGTNCASCHNTSGWTQVSVNHATTAFPLTGLHTSVACASCHVNGVYKGTPTDCYACHKSNDTHNGANGTNCASCHNTSGWTQVTVNHATTAFPLTGLHTSVACASCHVNGVYQGTPTDCYACHKSNDTHNGANGTNCASCHNTSGWTQVTVNHATTAFPLTGLHASVPCASCHVNGVYKGTPTDCYSCHKSNDTHNGANGTNCASCHNTSGWTQVTVNHATTAFPLTGLHASVACASCHVNGVYKGTPTGCYSCHKSSDAHLGSLGTTCSECHTTSGWTPATYNRAHTFPKNHGGATACSTCHQNTPSNFTTYTCYNCHQHTIANIQSRHSNISNYQNCIQCHANGGGG